MAPFYQHIVVLLGLTFFPIGCESLVPAARRAYPTKAPHFNRRSLIRSSENEPAKAEVAEVAESVDSEPAAVEAAEPEAPKYPRREGDIGNAANDIVQLVKPRADWWEEGPLSSPVRGVAETTKDDPLDQFILSTPVPAYGFLGLSGFVAIAFVGCIFQLFYDQPPAPVLGVPLTAAIFALSGPTWIFFFVAAIKKGQAESDAEDQNPY
mmetsp:Transcript_21102/g.47606  ORF Transcript_21102/g.47606 Transcript_21102/m.47606 type:complete len:209 (-) Transcript_21102:298-924(-)|eukprot:CAMPEP_0172597626 /NCGR_PEP_ID=MMETSP1068-20121228/17579_1 /TAXON_ID=35684 /ORGANISM="Pseudopedinella elastica, Strain CCMP716" /LENGTH=208 /DNA_ID=CAMNT_0013397181 /DNA_START=87 /DNA_END=713 /DNA_ORIENTATION=-